MVIISAGRTETSLLLISEVDKLKILPGPFLRENLIACCPVQKPQNYFLVTMPITSPFCTTGILPTPFSTIIL